jgi:hypothetical protein
MEDDLNKNKNGRQPKKKWEMTSKNNGRQPQKRKKKGRQTQPKSIG